MKFINRSVLPTQKIGKFLSSIFGISRYQSIRVCRQLGVFYTMHIQNVLPAKRQYIENYYFKKSLGIDLQRRVQNKISDKIRIGGYSGLRLSQGLPSRGQRSKTNAQTSKEKHRLSAKFKNLK
jgi:small subunit ribosomal protein S13